MTNSCEGCKWDGVRCLFCSRVSPVGKKDCYEPSLSYRLKLAAEDVEAENVGRACPVCGCALMYRSRRSDGHEFIGCSGWPDCNYTEDVE